MALNKIFEEARSHPPLNESTTCDWVIVPVLQEIGYASREIVSRLADNHGQFPDYTLLPETSHTWYLEAKDWRNALQDNHAQQALNYANQNGRRWVVLTNGNEWRLYDNRVMGPAPEKLVTRRPSDDFPALEELLRALGRESLVSGGLERFALRSRFRRFMEEQLRDEQSEVIRAIRQILRRQVGLADVSAREIRDYLGEGRSAVPESKLAPSPEPGPVPVPEPGPVPVPVPASDPPLGSEYGLDILSAQPKGSELVTGRKPVGVVFPDGTVVPVQSWNELACEVVRWVGSRHSIPIPFKGRGGKHYFLNSQPVHEDGSPMRGLPRSVQTQAQDVRVDTHRSAYDLLACTTSLVTACGEAPGRFAVSFRPGAARELTPEAVPGKPGETDGGAHRREELASVVLTILRETPAGLPLTELTARVEKELIDSLTREDRRWMPNHGKPRWQYTLAWALTTLKKEGRLDNPRRAFWRLASG